MAWTHRRRILALSLTLILALLCGPRPAWADVKLFLKDGTYQLVKSYEVRGDRVRYYSVERSTWEEVPLALVDFEATERAQREEKVEQQRQLDEAREISRERFSLPENAGFEVAPGIRLPKEEGVFAFDGIRVIRMIQSSSEIVTDRKRAALLLALPGPLLKNRAYVVLPGAKAAVRILSLQPTFYVQSADGLGGKLELVAVKPRKEARQVEKVEWRGGVGKPAELRAAQPLERSEVAPGLYKLSLVQPLELGEYALGELIQQKLNLELWDFGIDGAPASVKGDSDSPPKIRRSATPPKD
jgi:hypothetical protein